MNRLPTKPNITPTLIMNPSLTNRSFTFANDDGSSKVYTIHGLEITTLPYYIAIKIANQIADQICSERGQKNNYEADHKEALKEILV